MSAFEKGEQMVNTLIQELLHKSPVYNSERSNPLKAETSLIRERIHWREGVKWAQLKKIWFPAPQWVSLRKDIWPHLPPFLKQLLKELLEGVLVLKGACSEENSLLVHWLDLCHFPKNHFLGNRQIHACYCLAYILTFQRHWFNG